MTELVEVRTEGMIPELESMMLLLFDKNEIRQIAKMRKDYEMKMQRVTKNKEDCLRYIQYEMNLLKLVKMRRQKKGLKVSKSSSIDYAIANRLNKLFILAIRWFPSDVRIWLSYIKFCKQVRFYASASRVLDQMLEQHSDKPELFKLAAQWELEECLNVDKARKFLLSGLHIHKESRLLFTEAFKLELIHASNLRKQCKGLSEESHGKKGAASTKKRNSNKTTTEESTPINPDDPVVNGHMAELMYENAVKKIPDVAFVVDLLKLAQEYDFTKKLQNKIVNDMMMTFPSDELTWDTMAKRELQGFMFPTTPSNMATKLTMKEKIGRCVAVYEESVKNLSTERMWSLYLETLLELTRDQSQLPNFKRKLLVAAFQGGHNAGKLNENHYLVWVDHLQGADRGKKLSEVLEGATEKLSNSVTLWQTRLRVHLTRGEEVPATSVFNQAIVKLGPNALPLWKLMLQYWQTKRSSKVEELFKKAMNESAAISSPLKPLYLEWLVLTHGIGAARKVYASLCEVPPACVEMHTKMAALEAVQPTLSLKNARRCYLMACLQFGYQSVDVWMDYVKFEQNYGDASKAKDIYWQALKSLEPSQVDTFISEFSLVKTVPISQM